MPFTEYKHLFEASDLTLMQKAFDRLCVERRLAAKDKDQREELAAEVVRTFQQGAASEDDLWRTLSKRRSESKPTGENDG